MSEPLAVLMENAVQIAWDYLERTGQINDAAMTSNFLLDRVEELIRRGERSRLVLSNKAITAYEQMKERRVVKMI